MQALWKRMVRIFGHRWVSGYGESDDGTWLAGLQGLTVTQLGEGLRAMLGESSEWPPTLTQFRALCVTGGKDTRPHAAAYQRLPPPPPWAGPTETGRAGLREALAVLGLRSKDET